MGPFNNIAMKQAVHLLNLTDKGRFQPVLTAGYGSNSYSMLRERTNAGTTALYDLIRRSGVKRSGPADALALLVTGAFAQVEAEAPAPEPMLSEAGPSTEAGPSSAPAPAPERMKLDVFAKHVKSMLATCRPGTFGERNLCTVEGLNKTAPIGSGVGLLLWTTHEKNASGKGSRVTDATKRCVRCHGSFPLRSPFSHPPTSLTLRSTPHAHCPTSPFKAAGCYRGSRAQGQGRAAQAGLQGCRSAA